MATTTQEIKALKKEVQHLADAFEKSVKVRNNGHRYGVGINTDEMREAAHRAGDNVRHFMRHQVDRADVLRHQTEESIQSHPFRSVALGVASGLLLGTLLGRRS